MRTYRTYQSLAPARFQVRDGLRGGWYVIDTNPGTYSRFPSGMLMRDSFVHIYKNARQDYWRTYEGARNHAARLNAAAK